MSDRPTKNEIIDQIRLYFTKPGQTPGRGTFFKFSGINESEVTYYWPRWSDAVREAELPPLTVPERITDDAILTKLAELTVEIGHFPTTKEYAILCRNRTDLPSETTIRRSLGSIDNWKARLRAFAHGNRDFSQLLEIIDVALRMQGSANSKTVSGYVYLRKFPDKYKIGHTTSIPKREQQHRTKTWENQELVHGIETDDPKGIEDYWKRRFKEKNVK